MKNVICLAALLLLLSCGSGSDSPVSAGPANVSGTWKIVLNENQAQSVTAAHPDSANTDPNPTEIAISLQQSNAILTANGNIYSGNTGCTNGTAGWWWYNTGPYTGGWEFGTFSFEFDSGLVSGTTVSINLVEAMSFQNGQPTQSGTLKLLGTFQQDGTISGTLTDGCIPDASGNPSKPTFTATRITTFPPTSWP